ncbi:folylpolyglutamate synthase/dihydrofolate synthase family protein [Bacillus sp. EB600]|uniref:bifunctional folylpolyglutamate synthase/dihydrofolate synthase n=1 Tax=Bacillus sp. EB600 TaxID=2806345 RepID=UPI00210DEEF6|nr:folylpolyglutamate synthase/dihydrofolate synthase family protein [Bacillus sp. EB600]MCQ6278276.1 bifunctional folylpolyglutamate synthase/dihydrofolate synthase [Bacillus sp. EB600]
MFATYEEVLDWIHARLKLGIKPGLKRMEWMMEKLANPERELKAVHIGGTNGKGSTVTFLRSILQAGGYTVGTFTSPYIEQFNERISVNGKPISDAELLQLANVIRPLADELDGTELGGPTEFEVITAMAFYYFAKMHPVDIVIFEVGLGGRFDSTNIIQPMLSIITNIGLDHVNILGHTYEEIAFEKAGIIKQSTPVFTAVKRPDALGVIEKQAKKMEAPLFKINKDFTVENHTSLPKGERFSLKLSSGTLEEIEISMIGEHQTENAALAVMAALYLNEHHLYKLDEGEIKTGLTSAYWPGRFEVVSENPLVVLDGAHNDEGITALVHELNQRYHDREIHIIFCAMKDKKLDKMIGKLDEVADKITFVSFEFPRAASAETLFNISKAANKFANEDWQSVIRKEINNLSADSILVITGSLYFISEVKSVLLTIY